MDMKLHPNSVPGTQGAVRLVMGLVVMKRLKSSAVVDLLRDPVDGSSGCLLCPRPLHFVSGWPSGPLVDEATNEQIVQQRSCF